MDKLLLDVSYLSKIVKKNKVIDNINFKVHSGEIVGLLGLNGAGKSTLIKMLLGLTQPTNGKIYYFGKSLEIYMSSIFPRIGCVHEHAGFYEHLTIVENLSLVTNIVGVHKPMYMEELLENFDLADQAKMKVKQLSVASKKKLALVRALLNQPSILILDEPFNNLDFKTSKAISDSLLKLAREKNMGILISSHVLGELEFLADTLVIMHKGKVVKTIDKMFLDTYEERYQVYTLETPEKALKILNKNGYLPYLNKENKLMLPLRGVELDVISKIFIDNEIRCFEMYPHVLSLKNCFSYLIRNEMRQS